MKLRPFGIAAVYAIAVLFFTAPVYALEEPVGVPMGEIQYGDPNGGQGYFPGVGTSAGSDTSSYYDLQDAAGSNNATGSSFDGSPSSYGGAEGNIGTVVEPNQ